jgi:large subunit ribosomal protein L3
MTQVLFGTKQKMGEAYLNGIRRAVTRLSLYPLKVTAVKTTEKDGYESAVVSFDKKTREIPLTENINKGDTLEPHNLLQPGTLVSIQGTTKGKGFAGVVKRYGFAGGFKTHGQSDRHRAPGSIGQGTTPGRVHKGKKMPGRMGVDTHTVKNSLVVTVDGNDIWVTGPVPGNSGALLTLTLTGQKDAPKLAFLTGGLPAETDLPAAIPTDESAVTSEEVVETKETKE